MIPKLRNYLLFLCLFFCLALSLQKKCKIFIEQLQPSKQKQQSLTTDVKKINKQTVSQVKQTELTTLPINSEQQISICPQNSSCSENGYCQCHENYVLNCEVKSNKLNMTMKKFIVSREEKKYFHIIPALTKQYFFYKLNFCIILPNGISVEKEKAQQSLNNSQSANGNISNGSLNDNKSQQKYVYDIRLYGDDGNKSQDLEQNLIGNLTFEESNSTCWSLLSPILRFLERPNGEVQKLILTFQRWKKEDFIKKYSVDNKKEFKQPQNNNGKRRLLSYEAFKKPQLPVQLSTGSQQPQLNKTLSTSLSLMISVQEIPISSLEKLWMALFTFFILFGSGLFTLILFLIVFLRYHRRFTFGNVRSFRPHSLKHFSKYMPSFKLSPESKVVKQSDACSICLLNFQIGEECRQTRCSHIFHVQCLDQWCRGNLSCPVCREKLSSKNLKNIKRKKSENFDESLQPNKQNLQNPEEEEDEEEEEENVQSIQPSNFENVEDSDDPLESYMQNNRMTNIPNVYV